MSSITRDPLLAIAKGLLLFLMAVMLLGAAACLIAAPVFVFARQFIVSAIDIDLHGLGPLGFSLAIGGVLLLCAGFLVLIWKVLQLLKRIVDTVGEGDPFVPANADRLTLMAWLVLAVQLVTLPMVGIGVWLAHFVRPKDLQIDGGISGNGLLLMLVLFILARVFRQGAAMRAELEGTV